MVFLTLITFFFILHTTNKRSSIIVLLIILSFYQAMVIISCPLESRVFLMRMKEGNDSEAGANIKRWLKPWLGK